MPPGPRYDIRILLNTGFQAVSTFSSPVTHNMKSTSHTTWNLIHSLDGGETWHLNIIFLRCLPAWGFRGWGEVVKAQNQIPGPYFLTLLFATSTAWRNCLQRLFRFKKGTQHHQAIFLSNEAECSRSRGTENWTRRYSTEWHCLDLHNHSLCWWKKTYIFNAYMKPWEHLIKLTAVSLKKK